MLKENLCLWNTGLAWAEGGGSALGDACMGSAFVLKALISSAFSALFLAESSQLTVTAVGLVQARIAQWSMAWQLPSHAAWPCHRSDAMCSW